MWIENEIIPLPIADSVVVVLRANSLYQCLRSIFLAVEQRVNTGIRLRERTFTHSIT